MSEKQSALSMFEIVDGDEHEFLACRQIRSVCASVERQPDGMYLPSVSDDEYGESCASGQPLRTAELAAEAALMLARGHLRTLTLAFDRFTETADMVSR